MSDTLAALVKRKEAAEAAGDDAVVLPNLADLVPEASVVRCIVIGMDKTQGSRRIELSMKPSQVNQNLPLSAIKENAAVYGTVRSKEDRGWLVDLGCHRLQGCVCALNASVVSAEELCVLQLCACGCCGQG